MLLQFALGFVAAGAIALVAYRLGSLTTSGAVATLVLGVVVFGIGGVGASVPLVTFFVLSSALSRVGRGERRRRAEEAFEKGGRRDAAQVLANGGVAGALVLVGGAMAPSGPFSVLDLASASPAIFAAYLGSLAAAAADTWGTEIGILGRGPVISLATFRRVEPGRSGGVSAHGTLGALVGAAVVALSGIVASGIAWGGTAWSGTAWGGTNWGGTAWTGTAWTGTAWTGTAWGGSPWALLAAAIAGGMAGMLADGLAGATLQERRRCVGCGRLTERDLHCGRPTAHAGGIASIGNDAVNLLCCIVGAAVAWLIVALA